MYSLRFLVFCHFGKKQIHHCHVSLWAPSADNDKIVFSIGFSLYTVDWAKNIEYPPDTVSSIIVRYCVHVLCLITVH